MRWDNDNNNPMMKQEFIDKAALKHGVGIVMVWECCALNTRIFQLIIWLPLPGGSDKFKETEVIQTCSTLTRNEFKFKEITQAKACVYNLPMSKRRRRRRRSVKCSTWRSRSRSYPDQAEATPDSTYLISWSWLSVDLDVAVFCWFVLPCQIFLPEL